MQATKCYLAVYGTCLTLLVPKNVEKAVPDFTQPEELQAATSEDVRGSRPGHVLNQENCIVLLTSSSCHCGATDNGPQTEMAGQGILLAGGGWKATWRSPI